MKTESAKPPRRWQFTLRTFFLAVALIAFATWYGIHFRRMTVRANHHLTILRQPFILLTTIIPREGIEADNRIREWHQAKAEECLTARWYPWREVDESFVPQITVHVGTGGR